MEALDIITREVPEIVITDIVMEDKNGIDIMDFIATQSPLPSRLLPYPATMTLNMYAPC